MNTALTAQQTKTIIPLDPQRRRAVADIRSEPRPASDRNRWPASYWNAWPASSESSGEGRFCSQTLSSMDRSDQEILDDIERRNDIRREAFLPLLEVEKEFRRIKELKEE